MGQVSPVPTTKEPPEQGATYHRVPPSAPGSSRVLHMIPGALLLGAAVALWFRGVELLLKARVPIEFGLALPAIEGVLAFLGTIFLAQGAAALLRGMRRGLGAQFKPSGKWRWEWPWNREGVEDPLAVRMRERFTSVPIALVAMVPVGYFLWISGLTNDRRFAAVLLAPAAVILVLAIASLIHLKMRGRGRLQFHTFPFALGGTLQARYFPSLRMLGFGSRMRATLRCIEIVSRASGGQVNARELWRWTEDAEIVGGVSEIILEITAPASLATRFKKPVRFWELEVGPWVPGAAGNATFVVPVYVDPSHPHVDATPAQAPPKPIVRRAPSDRPATAPRKPSSAPPVAGQPRRTPSNPPAAPEATPASDDSPVSNRLPSYPPVPVPRMEQPGALPSANPTPFGIPINLIRPGERFRCELTLTPALSVEELSDRVSQAFEMVLSPLPGAEEGTFFGRSDGLEVALQAGGESRRLVLGGVRPPEPGHGDPSERALEWAIAKLMVAGVAARRPD